MAKTNFGMSLRFFSISFTRCIRPSNSRLMAAACSSAESSIKALNKIWCSNFFTLSICWNISYNCSLESISSLFNDCCKRAGFFESSSPVPFSITSNFAIQEKNIMIALYCITKRFVSHDLCFSLKKSLKSLSYGIQLRFVNFGLSFRHVGDGDIGRDNEFPLDEEPAL
ncbi:hypothetical protein FF38_00657 [Lucilia cuprina]|uniref:Uncharacterized protein n=1 Tax=Lucilia cuprina TaxID=7375 RepID=A0A0L0C3D2_LUCCU|nr:hypothetical protein FF38_00657 [Lucilia cuprina]